MHHVSDIATDPAVEWLPGKICNGKLRHNAIGAREGTKVKVVIENEGEGIITAFPMK